MADIDLGKIQSMIPETAAPASPKPASTGGGKKWGAKPGVLTFYKLQTVPDSSGKTLERPHYRVTKFDSDLNVESSYIMNYMPSNNGGYYDCQCPASKFDCRHKMIQKEIETAGEVDSERFFCFETRVFKRAEEIR